MLYQTDCQEETIVQMGVQMSVIVMLFGEFMEMLYLYSTYLRVELNKVHVATRSAKWFLQAFTSDTSKGEVGNLRASG